LPDDLVYGLFFFAWRFEFPALGLCIGAQFAHFNAQGFGNLFYGFYGSADPALLYKPYITKI